MSRHVLLRTLSGLVLAGLIATPADAGPRETTRAVAAAIRENFFDEAAAARIAGALEAEAAAGAYDALTEPGELASTLSDRLRPEDPHFVVTWDAGGPVVAGGPAPARMNGMESAIASNFGFAEVRILPGNIGYVRMSFFAPIDFSEPDDSVRAAADAVLALVSFTDAVIFDVRDNGGGAPSMVGYLVSAFTPPDADIYNTFVARNGTRQERAATPYATPRLDVPVYVLTSGRTGSAAEGFAYTLQSAGRARIVGEASGGAANPGGMTELGDGFSVFVSFARPVNPITGTNWGGAGVQPDLPSRWDEALVVAQRDALTRLAAREDSPGLAANAAWALEALDPPLAAAAAEADYVGGYGLVSVAGGAEGLRLVQGRRPPRRLERIGEDLYRVIGDPTSRVRFLRNEAGRVSGLETLSTASAPVRRRRDG